MPSIVEPQSTNPDVRTLSRIKALEERVAALERGLPLPIVTGTPGAGTGTDGSQAADTGLRLWVKVGGTWRYTNLT